MDTRATMDILKRGYNKINTFNNVIINIIYLKEFLQSDQYKLQYESVLNLSTVITKISRPAVLQNCSMEEDLHVLFFLLLESSSPRANSRQVPF